MHTKSIMSGVTVNDKAWFWNNRDHFWSRRNVCHHAIPSQQPADNSLRYKLGFLL